MPPVLKQGREIYSRDQSVESAYKVSKVAIVMRTDKALTLMPLCVLVGGIRCKSVYHDISITAAQQSV